MYRALFLDRDGVINVDYGYVDRPEKFEIIPSIIPVLRMAQAEGYLLVVITNQSGIARGYFTEKDYAALEAHMCRCFAEHEIAFAGVYHCPHHPEGSVPELSVVCDCRKPAPGLILRAASEHDIDLSESILVGDKLSDIAAASAAGVGRAILVRGEGVDGFGEVVASLSVNGASRQSSDS